MDTFGMLDALNADFSNEKRERQPLKPLHIPIDFDEAVKALLGTPTPPKGAGSRKGRAQKARKKSAKTRASRR
jgi:hypothetical protein